MSEVEWRGRTVPVKIDKARIFLLGLADNEAAITQVYKLILSQFIFVFTSSTVVMIEVNKPFLIKN